MQLKPVLLLLLTACATPREASRLGVGDTLAFRLPRLEGGQVSPSDLLGKVVLVDLWATWCKPCKVSLPFYKSLHQQRAQDGFDILAVSVDLHKDDVEQFLEAEQLPFAVLHDPDGTLPRQIGIDTMPTMLLLGRDGKIAYVHTGFESSDRDRIAAEVDKALAAGGVAPGDAPK
jgi:peroxiredoxin